MKTTTFFAAIAAMALSAAAVSCSSTKNLEKTRKSTEVALPLTGKEYKTDKDHFRAVGMGSSIDLTTAKKIATQNAKTEIASGIQTTVKAVTDQYTNQRTVGNKQDFENKFEELSRTVVGQTLTDIKTIGEKMFQQKDGSYTCYIALEVTKESVVTGLSNGISKDAKLQLDFDKAQYTKIFNEEMKKLENQ